MKKIIAGVATAAALSLTFAGAGAAEAYGPTTPHQVKHDIIKVISHPGKITAKKANKLKREVRAAKKAGIISPKAAAKLIKKINKDTRHHH